MAVNLQQQGSGMSQNHDSFEQRLVAQDRLLKALIGVLTIKEPTLVQQLDSLFVVAAHQRNDTARMSQRAWEEIQKELNVIHQLIHGEGAERDGSYAPGDITH